MSLFRIPEAYLSTSQELLVPFTLFVFVVQVTEMKL